MLLLVIPLPGLIQLNNKNMYIHIKRILAIAVILLMFITVVNAQGIHNVMKFGAKGDGITDDAKSIQRAIDACSKAGGGIVMLPASHTIMAGPFNLKSNIDFHNEVVAKLLANPDEKIYTQSAFRKNPGEGMIWIGG